MSTPFQIVIDCFDPHELVRFWAAAMDYEIEDNDAQVRHVLEQGWATEDDSLEIDGRLAWKSGAACRSEDGTTRLLCQLIDEPTQGKNRVHLDLRVGAEQRDAEVDRLLALGATRLWDGQQGPLSWVTLADPEGNEFCVA
ncbi:MAG: VOC family protein [Egibacteraceae bacterium]